LFGRRDLAQQIGEVLDKHQLDPALVELEITESSVMQDQEQADDLLSALRCLGVSLALDDFGVGHSSLSRLRSLPVDKLKIDQSFVRDVLEDSQDAAIVRSIIALGSSMQMLIQAEGIETEQVSNFMAEIQCNLGQG